MATFRGQDGSVTNAGGTVGQVRQWSCSIQQELLDASTMGDDWKKHRGGMASWSGSIEMLFDYADAGQAAFVDKLVTASPDGLPITATLRVDTSKQITGSLIIKACKIDDTLNDLVKLSAEYEGSGPPTFTWA